MSTDTGRDDWNRGAIAWMVHNPVAANLLMLVLLIGGFMMASEIRQEVFPEFELDVVTVSVLYPGATPEEVEQGVVTVIEEAVRNVDGVSNMTSRAGESSGSVTLEVLEGEDAQLVYQRVQQAVAQIVTFPLDAEQPRVALAAVQQQVVGLQLYGDVGEHALREYAEDVRDRLLQSSGISRVDLTGARAHEVRISVPQHRLQAHGLSLNQIATRVRENALDVGGGRVDTDAGEILLRLNERRDWATEFAQVPVVTTAGGSVVRLGDIAEVSEGFVDNNSETGFNGLPSIGLGVYRVGNQTPVAVAQEARRVLAEIESELPPGVNYAVSSDTSEVYQQRLELLLKNAGLGLLLVLIVLGIFLEMRLAFWVTMGIPISFLGAFLFLPTFDVTINMISLFAFIIALGIVVDDAIVAGENMYEYRQRGHGLVESAIRGAQQVAVPITFSILSNIVAFLPLMMVPGVAGSLFGVIPAVVISVFVISWVEALFVMPAHLAYERYRGTGRVARALHGRQQAFSAAFSRFVQRVYLPLLQRTVVHRYVTAAAGVAMLVTVLAWAASGRLGFMMMPVVESDESVATVTMPYGSPMSEVRAARDRLVEAVYTVAPEHGDALLRGVFARVQENTVTVNAYLTDPETRPISTGEFTRRWRAAVDTIPGAESQQFQADFGGPGGGAAITVELSHRDTDVLDRASRALAAGLEQFGQTRDIDSGSAQGKPQLDFRLTAAGRSLGLTADEIGRQVRAAFYGAEAVRQQRGRHEISVMVTLPEAERRSEADVMGLLVRTPAGRYVPLSEVTEVSPGRAYTEINRRDGRRTQQVTANVEPRDQAQRIVTDLRAEVLPELMAAFPGLSYSFQGQQADMADSLRSLGLGFIAAVLMIYVLMAIPFRSYAQPLIVMLAIPFGVIGAILGHALMGYSLSVISLMGVVALAGVVVNGSLVLIHYANGLRDAGASVTDAISQASARRFRPILLTTLTTFGGLAPMIFETSLQARFMIPMAISLGFGILFAAFITLLLVPSFYVILEDLRGRGRAPEPLLPAGRAAEVTA